MSGKCYAIIVAAGKGLRMGSHTRKQYLILKGKSVVMHTLDVFANSPLIDGIVLVIASADEEYVRESILKEYSAKKPFIIAIGGKERQQSVYNGLMALPDNVEFVMIHDAVRPFVTQDIIGRSLETAKIYGSSVVGMPVKDTIKRVDSLGFVTDTPERNSMWMVQTPQTFKYSVIVEAHQRAQKMRLIATDDAALVEKMGKPVKMVEGSYMNIKLTTPEDMAIAESYMAWNIQGPVGGNKE